MDRLHEIEALGTAVWIDNLTRDLLEEGRCAPSSTFAAPFDALIETIGRKTRELQPAAR